MTEVDELDINPFFKALQTRFSAVYQKAEDDCNLICIPKAECIQGAYITQKFVYTHILRPSPFFKGQYMTLLSDKQTVTVGDRGDYVTTDEGFPTKVKIKVISEELCYNKDYKPYKILIIDRPLDLNVMKKQPVDEKTQSGEFKLKYSQNECREVLKSYPEFSKHIKELDSQIGKFNHNYILLKDYLEEAMKKLQTMQETTSENCISSVKRKALVSHQFKDYISSTLEIYLMSSVHKKLYPVICERCHDNDLALARKCRALHGLTPDQLGIPEHFCCPLPSSVVELAHLDSLITPIEKLYCLKTTFDNITEEIDKNVQESQPPGVAVEDAPCLTSDDLIPILFGSQIRPHCVGPDLRSKLFANFIKLVDVSALSTQRVKSFRIEDKDDTIYKVTVIVQAKCRHIHTDIFYMENFYWSAGTKDREIISYCLVTFTAAVQYMMSTDFSDIDVKSKLEENEVNFQDLIKNDISSVIQPPQQLSRSPAPGLSGGGRARAESRSRFDRQIDNISKMLEETAVETKTRNEKSAPLVFPSLFGGPPSKSPLQGKSTEKKSENMGDFLSGLEDNMFLSFGKQT